MRDGCAARSRALGGPVHGSASRARRWVLVEHPGAWGADVLNDPGLPAAVAAHLRWVADALPARVLLLRRPGGASSPDGRRVVLAGVSTPSGGWLEQLTLDALDEVRDLDLTGLRDGAAGTVGGRRLADPVHLVCTNGKHDACCAEYGLAVTRALAPVLGERLWECSHVGGDRFAGNLVCLPEGVFYGHLDPDSALRAVAAHEDGRLMLEHWRGRSALAFPAQAAEALVRAELGLDELAAGHVAAVERGGGGHRVRLRRAGGERVTAVVRVHAQEPRPLTCGGAPASPPGFTLLELATG